MSTRTIIAAAAAISLITLAALLAPGRSGASRAQGVGEDLAPQVAEWTRQVAELRAALAEGQPGALAHLEVPTAMELFGRRLPMERPEIREAVAYELVLTVGKPTMPLLWMRRAPVALPPIESRLQRAGLPADLKYVAMIESDLRWTPESPAGAIGLWQFVNATGRRFGLAIDRNMDERKDPDRSTDAALAYLVELHREFGDWLLAVAAYNAGENALRQALAEQGARGYFDLYLPYETRRYVPRLIAAKLVFESPERYGLFRMTPLYSPKYRYIDVESRGGGVDLRQLARERGLDYSTLRSHNPQLRSWLLPPGRHRLRTPEGGGGLPGETGG